MFEEEPTAARSRRSGLQRSGLRRAVVTVSAGIATCTLVAAAAAGVASAATPNDQGSALADTAAASGHDMAGMSMPAASPSGTATTAPMVMPAAPFAPNLDPGESNTVSTIPALTPSRFPQEKNVGFHEFQVNCSVTRVAPDDPIVYPKQPGVSHSHTFTGGQVDSRTTTGSLMKGATSCTTPGDHSAYWFPTMYDGDREVIPSGPQIVYYKAGVDAYNTIRPFPKGLRLVVGDAKATAAEFQRDSRVSGWVCGRGAGNNWDFPTYYCPKGNTLLVRYKAASCWDGKHLDSPDHRSHMSYPVNGKCDTGHPVALPSLEMKIAYPVTGDLTRLRLSSGRGYSWHADFFAAWDMPTQAALVTQCINGGGQCDARGYDQHKASRGRVLDDQYRLIRK